MADQPPRKRPRLDDDHASDVRNNHSAFLDSLSRAVSPPLNIQRDAGLETTDDGRQTSHSTNSDTSPKQANHTHDDSELDTPPKVPNVVPSPFQLTKVRGIPAEQNKDTVSLHEILGDPLIRQAWIFNFCFDVDWTMRHFDADVRELVDVKIVHGSWRKEDGNRLGIEQDLEKWKNVRAIQAYLPDQFGTHHSKMIILFKHDDTAQVIIHTANMLERDWDHMTQAVWRSPTLALAASDCEADNARLGSGTRFQKDLLRYFTAYGYKLKELVTQLKLHDFSAVKAALIASVPSRVNVSDPASGAWGHLALRHALRKAANSRISIPQLRQQHLICQISSIATLPATWLDETIIKATSTPTGFPSTSIIYPTLSDLREALTGYTTGGSIHTKIESAAQQKQVTALRPHLHRWGVQQADSSRQARRHSIPPHIKTYICFESKPTSNDPTPDIDWVLVTSANLSQQAWGTAAKPPKGIKDPNQAVSHIQSFEIGVLVWPELFADDVDEQANAKVRMVPVFGKDTPDGVQTNATSADTTIVGMRMPYDLPLTPYAPGEMPWSPSSTYHEPDRLGRTWP